MSMHTEFAPAERAPMSEVTQHNELLTSLPFVQDVLDSVPNIAMVLNKERQIVFANQAFREFAGVGESPEALIGARQSEALGCAHLSFLGKRPGEAAGCIRSGITEGGCGTSFFCRTCGAVQSIVNSQKSNKPDVQECRMVCGESEDPLDLRVWSRPLEIHGEVFTVFSVMDISNEKRRKALERIFFHDILNTAGGVKGLADLLAEMDLSEEEKKEIVLMLSSSSDQLVEEINAQRFLLDAERGDLAVWAQKLQLDSVLEGLRRQFHAARCAKDKKLVIINSSSGEALQSDPVLLRRILGNLVKNAFEASAKGEEVVVRCTLDENGVSFSVKNNAVLSREVQSQIFMRSFSTKGAGRGIGTYSVKLLTERYLKGTVSIESSEDTGTVFTVRFPHKIDGDCPDLEALRGNKNAG